MNGYHSKHLVNVICKLLILTIYLGLDLLGVSDGQLIIVLFTNGLQELFHDLQQEHQNSKFISRLNLIDIFDWAFGYLIKEGSYISASKSFVLPVLGFGETHNYSPLCFHKLKCYFYIT